MTGTSQVELAVACLLTFDWFCSAYCMRVCGVWGSVGERRVLVKGPVCVVCVV